MREQSRVPACFLAGPRGCGLERGRAGRALVLAGKGSSPRSTVLREKINK